MIEIEFRPQLELFRFKPGVVRSQVHPLMWSWLGVIGHDHFEVTGDPATVTSLRRPYSPTSSSRHAPPKGKLATAADIRRHSLDDLDDGDPTRKTAERFCRELQRCYGRNLGVVLEPEWLTIRDLEKRFGITVHNEIQERAARRRVGPHIHTQLKGRLWVP